MGQQDKNKNSDIVSVTGYETPYGTIDMTVIRSLGKANIVLHRTDGTDVVIDGVYKDKGAVYETNVNGKYYGNTSAVLEAVTGAEGGFDKTEILRVAASADQTTPKRPLDTPQIPANLRGIY